MQESLTIKVNKVELLAILESNRTKHAADYEKAKAGFRKLLEKELEKKLQQCRDGKKVELLFKNQKPESHLGDYDDIIGMLKLSTDTELSMTQQQYRNYVQDKWNWKQHWMLSNNAYLSAVA